MQLLAFLKVILIVLQHTLVYEYHSDLFIVIFDVHCEHLILA